MIENPRWVDRALKQCAEEVQKVARNNGLPMPVGGPRFKELGCGHYGCVLPTEDDSIVFKLTSDRTEGEFLRRTLSNEMSIQDPEDYQWGMVIYHAVVELDFTYRNKPVYAIWREEASNIGGLIPTFGELRTFDGQEKKASLAHLTLFLIGASSARDTLKRASNPRQTLRNARLRADWAHGYVMEHWVDAVRNQMQDQYYYRRDPWTAVKSADRVAVGLALCEAVIMYLQTSDRYLGSVGFVLDHFFGQGIILADVHANNIGQVVREFAIYDDEDVEVDEIWAITDPGHAFFLRDLED